MLFSRRSRSLDATFFLLVVAWLSSVSGEEPVSQQKPKSDQSIVEPARKNLELPGMVINFRERCVDVEATVCLDKGMLELIACVKGSKEHESILSVEAKPMHIHTALLLLGANNGAPATRRSADAQKTRWIDVPPKGDPVRVFLVRESAGGRLVEHSISEFVSRSDDRPDESGAAKTEAEKEQKFPDTFVFAGSYLREDGPGPRQYLADQSGHVISIATFGDELLCLPGMHAHANSALMWQVDARKLPKVGTKVTLRLRPQNKPASNR